MRDDGSQAPVSGADSGGKGFFARHRRAAASLLGGAVVFGFFYYVVPQIVGLGPTLHRLRRGNVWWFSLGLPFEALSILAYAALFRSVFSPRDARIGWKASYQITMAGGAATKLFAAAGSGGVALTVWALRASGLPSALVAREMVCFEIVNYAVYMLALVICGLGLWFGLFAGGSPVGLTLVPALFGLLVIALVLSMGRVGVPLESFMLERAQHAQARAAHLWKRVAGVPKALHDGLGSALELVRGEDHSWLTVIPAWGFEIATLWACFRAFGPAPPVAVLVMGFYVGTLGNVLPLPGGIGGVEGGMIAAFIGFGVDGSLAVLAVLGYRTISYWIPLLPEGIAYLQLRHTVGDWREHSPGSAAAGQLLPGHGAGGLAGGAAAGAGGPT